MTMYHADLEREKNTVGSRIAEARRERGLSLRRLSELLESSGVRVTAAAISKWEMGGAVPNAYQLLALCHVLELEDGLRHFSDSYPEGDLNALGMRKLRDYRTDLVASGRYRPRPNLTEIRMIEMPVSRIPVSAGTGAFLEADSFERIPFPVGTIPAGAEFGLRVQGDSMEPVYQDGQIVWVQRCSRLRLGEVGVFLYDGDGYLKVYGEQLPPESERERYIDSSGVLHMQPVLISYNDRYPPRPVRPDTAFTIAGRVLN